MAIEVLAGPVIPHRGAWIGVAGGDLDITQVHALWVPKTCVTWEDALRTVVGSARVQASVRQDLVRPEVR